MPDERQLRSIAAASLDEQKEVWKAHKPSKGYPLVSWWSIANGLARTRMYATLIEVESEEDLQLIWSRPNRD